MKFLITLGIYIFAIAFPVHHIQISLLFVKLAKKKGLKMEYVLNVIAAAACGIFILIITVLCIRGYFQWISKN